MVEAKMLTLCKKYLFLQRLHKLKLSAETCKVKDQPRFSSLVERYDKTCVSYLYQSITTILCTNLFKKNIIYALVVIFNIMNVPRTMKSKYQVFNICSKV